MSGPGLVTLLTDFGAGSAYVGQMHATILRVAPAVRIVDLAHDCPPGSVAAGAYVLQRSYRHAPEGTVHAAVVDPGVGSARAILAARAHGHVFLAPNNGLLGSVLADAEDPEVRRVENRALMAEQISRTFHGRDIIAPVAARLASGMDLAEVGDECAWEPARPGPEMGERSIEGRVLFADRFGNLITNIPRVMLQALGDPSRIRVRAGATFIDGLVQTFTDVPRGVALVYVGSGDHLEIAVNSARADELLALQVGSEIRVERRA